MSVTAMIGTGLIATPTANVSTALIPSAMTRNSRSEARSRSKEPLRGRYAPSNRPLALRAFTPYG